MVIVTRLMDPLRAHIIERDWADMDRWITDTETTERFPLYTRANADEVGPDPFTPLNWSLAWEQGAALGTADAWAHLGAFRPEEFRSPVPEVFGCWGGYFYNQVSVPRVFSVRAPGASPDQMDRAYFGENAEVPPYQADPRDQDESLTEQLGRTIGWIMSTDVVPEADDFAAKVRRWAAERPQLQDMSGAALVAHGRTACHRLRETWDVYAQVVVGASVGPGAVHAIASALGRADDAVAVFTALGGVETADTSRRMWELSRLVRSSSTLSSAFDGGTSGLLDRIRASGEPDSGAFLDQFTALLTEYGHRGPNEWDIASPSWLTQPEIALQMVDRVRLQTDEHAPGQRSGAGQALREKVTAELEELLRDDPATLATLRSAIRSGQLFYRAREAGKDAAVRVMLEAKLPFIELGRRMHKGGVLVDPSHVFQLLDSELDAFVEEPAAWTDRLRERAEQFAMLGQRQPPYTVMHGRPVPPIDDWPPRGGRGEEPAEQESSTFSGIGVSPGVVTGPARVVYDLSEAHQLEPGEVLVCASTDPSWAPLFMVAGAVVCEIGAQASHAAIVSRELGVPCVVSAPGARSRIRTGSTVTVDGSAGTVTVVGP